MKKRADCVLDDLLLGEIALVADKQLVHAFRRVSVDLLQPLLDVGERVVVCHIVNDDDAVSPSVYCALSTVL